MLKILSISVKKSHVQPDLEGLFQYNFLPPLDLSSFSTLLVLQDCRSFPYQLMLEITPSSPDVSVLVASLLDLHCGRYMGAHYIYLTIM